MLITAGQDQLVDTGYQRLVHETISVGAPARTVAAALAEPWLLRRCADEVGVRLRAVGEQFGAGDELELSAFGLPVRLRVARADEHGLVLVSLGRGPGCGCRRLSCPAAVRRW